MILLSRGDRLTNSMLCDQKNVQKILIFLETFDDVYPFLKQPEIFVSALLPEYNFIFILKVM